MQIPPIIAKLQEYQDRNGEYWISRLSNRTGVGIAAIKNILLQRRTRHKVATLKTLYSYFKIPYDDFYQENLRKIYLPTETLLGSLLREKRIQKNMSIADISGAIKVDEKTIKNIESGRVLPQFNQYTFKSLLDIYDFTEEERTIIAWWITITHDLIDIHRTHSLVKNPIDGTIGQ